jgi:hypothetical protein
MFGFLKIKKHESKGFKYKPRFYDAEKEALNAKAKAINSSEEISETDTEKEFVKIRIKEELQHAKTTARRDMRGLWKGGNLRLISIIIILVLISYFILHRFLPAFIQYLFPEG